MQEKGGQYRSTDVAVIEKECIYILFADPDNFQPKLTFLSLKDLPSQDAKSCLQLLKHSMMFKFHF